jgi:hypothetical protein
MSAENIKLVTSSFKPLTDDELKRLADEVYDDSTDSEVLNDLRNVLNPDVLEYSTDNRKVPEYADGFLD